MKTTKAKRSLLPEKKLLHLKWRLEIGVKLNTALRLLEIDGAPNVYTKLVAHHNEMESALIDEDEVLFDTIRDSLFPHWIDQDQPDNAKYNGYFPYGYWSYTND